MGINDIKRILVVGAGLMGHGIGQEFALSGYNVLLNDLDDERLEHAVSNIKRNLHMMRELGIVAEEEIEPTLKRIQTSVSLKEMASEADVVIEAVYENLTLKKNIFRELDEFCPDHTILASNTSSYMPSELASVTNRPEKVLVTHYFNPPHLLPLVEIVRSPLTSDESVNKIYDLLVKVGKKPAVVQKEAPGFIGNRLQMALGREALSIIEKGIASAKDVDTVIKNGFGRRLSVAGMFEIFDIAGWDLAIPVYSYIVPDLEVSKEVPQVLKEKVDRGELGVKTGKGFYEYTPESAEELRRRIAMALVEISRW
jgi:3-hydroxybutyryl-CoA dehydrogenase